MGATGSNGSADGAGAGPREGVQNERMPDGKFVAMKDSDYDVIREAGGGK